MTRTYEVWHKDIPAFVGATPADLKAFPAGYTHVANVTTDAIYDVFRLTNHIDAPWDENPGVQKTVSRGVRSTSVGDVVVDTNTGTRYTYLFCGLGTF